MTWPAGDAALSPPDRDALVAKSYDRTYAGCALLDLRLTSRTV